MGFCTRKYIFLSICLLQMISVVERQVFDFLGYLWIPILVNFFEIVFIIFGFFGAYQYRPKYIISYLIWQVFWLAWNIFIVCLYLDVAKLDHKTNKVLKLDNDSGSWWKEGPGCKKIHGNDDPRNVTIKNCLVDYVYVEVFQAGLQCFLTLLNCIIGIFLNRAFLEEDDTFNYEKADGPDSVLLHPMYVSCSEKSLCTNNNSSKISSKSSKRTQNSFDRCASINNRKRMSEKRSPRNIPVDSIRFDNRRKSVEIKSGVDNSLQPVRPKSLIVNNACF